MTSLSNAYMKKQWNQDKGSEKYRLNVLFLIVADENVLGWFVFYFYYFMFFDPQTPNASFKQKDI